jgi:glycosyltransferase involved in cell wall biosynthesis
VIGIYPVFSDLVVAAALSRTLGVPLIVDFRDDLAGVMTRGWRRIYRPFYRRLERRLVRAATRVTVTTQELADDLASRHGVSGARFRVLPNIVPPGTGGSQATAERESANTLTVVYAGAMSSVQRPELLLQAHRHLLRRRPDLAGRLEVEMCGPENRYFRRRVAPHIGPGSRFLGFLPRAEVDGMMARADVGYLGLNDDTFAYATPTKLFDYVEFGLPILGSLPRGAARRTVEENGLGIVCGEGDVEAVAAGLERFADDAAFRRTCRDRMSYVREGWSTATQGERWRSVVREAISQSAAGDMGTADGAPGSHGEAAITEMSAGAVEQA